MLINSQYLYCSGENLIVFSLNHTKQKWPPWEKKKKGQSYSRRLTCHEHFQNSSRLAVLMIAIQIHTFVLCNLTVLFPIYVMGASLQCDYVSKGTFSSGMLLLDFFFLFLFLSNSLYCIPQTGKQTKCSWSRKLKEIKAGQSDLQTGSWAETGC